MNPEESVIRSSPLRWGLGTRPPLGLSESYFACVFVCALVKEYLGRIPYIYLIAKRSNETIHYFIVVYKQGLIENRLLVAMSFLCYNLQFVTSFQRGKPVRLVYLVRSNLILLGMH